MIAGALGCGELQKSFGWVSVSYTRSALPEAASFSTFVNNVNVLALRNRIRAACTSPKDKPPALVYASGEVPKYRELISEE
jgi:hypothetical protein